MHLGRYFYNKTLFSVLPKFKKAVHVMENVKMRGFEKRKNRVYEDLTSFHKKMKLEELLTMDSQENLRTKLFTR